MSSYPVIDFWFDEIEEDKWWQNDQEFDELVKGRFLSMHQAAVRGELYRDRDTALGRCQEIILLDQFSRNIFRGTAKAFFYDAQALVLSQEAIRAGANKELSGDKKAFLYLPFMHSESLIIHERAMELFSEPDLQGHLEYEIQHRDIIVKFGRYPHRNAALGRHSSEKELEFMNEVSDF